MDVPCVALVELQEDIDQKQRVRVCLRTNIQGHQQSSNLYTSYGCKMDVEMNPNVKKPL